MAQTTTEFLAEVKLRGMIPSSQSLFTDANLLQIGDGELDTHIFPMVLRARENYYEYDDDRTIDSSQDGYAISNRAYGGGLVNAALVEGTRRQDLSWCDEESLTDYDTSNTGNLRGYFKRSLFKLIPKDGGGWTTLRMTILLRHGKLVATDSAAQITAIDTATKTLTFAASTIPSAWDSDDTFDLIQADAPFDTLAIDQGVSSVTSTTIVFDSTLPTRLAVGDWVALADQSPVVQVPKEFFPYLCQLTANTCLRILGHEKALKRGESEADRMEKQLNSVIQPRMKKEGKKIINRSGILRVSRM